MTTEDVNVLISDLISKNFIDEERFAETYASGKFRIKKWGKVKIIRELKARNISDYSIKKGIAGIDDETYLETLKSLANKKLLLLKSGNKWEKNAKLKRYLSSKGYESDLIYAVLKEFIN